MIRIIERYEPDGKKQVVFMFIEKVALSQLNGLRLHAYDELQTSRGSGFLIRIRRRAQKHRIAYPRPSDRIRPFLPWKSNTTFIDTQETE